MIWNCTSKKRAFFRMWKFKLFLHLSSISHHKTSLNVQMYPTSSSISSRMYLKLTTNGKTDIEVGLKKRFWHLPLGWVGSTFSSSQKSFHLSSEQWTYIDINMLTWATICRTSYKCDVFEAFNSFIKIFFVGGYNMKLLVCDLDDFNKPSVLRDNEGSQTAKPPYHTHNKSYFHTAWLTIGV